MHASLKRLEPLVDRPCELAVGDEAHHAIVFDWSKLTDRACETFVGELFGDWDGKGAAFRALVTRASRGKGTKVVWASERYVPFALVNVDRSDAKKKFRGGADYPQFARLLLADVGTKGAPVVALDVDGTAIATKTLPKVSASVDALPLAPTASRAKKTAAASDPAPGAKPKARAGRGKDAAVARDLERAVDALFGALSDYRIARHGIAYGKPGLKDVPPNKAKASQARARCEALIAKTGELTEKSELIATTLGAGGVARDYRALLSTLSAKPIDERRWKSVGIDRFARDKQFFRSLHAGLVHKATGTTGWKDKPLEGYGKKRG